MSRRKSWSGNKRVFFAVLAVVALATSAWAAISHTAFSLSPAAAKLEAPIPPPQDVRIQQRDNSDGVGNIFVLVQLSPEQVKAKQLDGTADFLTIGDEESTVILRDDGVGGDTEAGDGLYTGIADADMEELQARAALDQEVLESNPDGLVPVFEGRAATGVVRPAAFDFSSFAAGETARLVPRASFLHPEGVTPPPLTFDNPVVPGTNSFQDQALMIASTTVITDSGRTWNPCSNTGTANGVWTFNHLMTQMAGSHDPSDFVLNWLNKWTSAYLPPINGDPVPARSRMQDIIDQWPKLTNGKLDLTKSPLRLLAIVPRVDLRGGGGGYGGGNFTDAGELRFIFGFVAKAAGSFSPSQAFTGADQINQTSCYALPFTVIFEYRVPRVGCEDVKDWAQQWKALGDMTQPVNWTTYKNQLAGLTEAVVTSGANSSPQAFNGSALSQLRTNEVALGAPWELREFQLASNLGQQFGFLEPHAVKDTIQNDPTNDINGTAHLLSWIQDVVKPALTINNSGNIPDIPPAYTPPASTVSKNFIAGDARIITPDPDFITFYWSAPGLNLDIFDSDPLIAASNLKENWARHRVSLESCNGCHNRETFTHFVHVNPANTTILSTWFNGDWTRDTQGHIFRASSTLPAELSLFLTGINQLGDPANAMAIGADDRSPFEGDPKRNFDDLARRELDLTNVAGMNCSGMRLSNRERVLRSLEMTGKLPEDLFEGTSSDAKRSVSIDDLLRNVITEVH